MNNKFLLGLLLSLASPAVGEKFGRAVYTDKFKTPGIIFSSGGMFDRSFNQLSNKGAMRFQKKTGIKYDYLEIKKTNQHRRHQLILAQRGADPIVLFGSEHVNALKKTARQHPKSHFYIVDAVVDAPNVSSIIFRDHEGSFLVGALAAMKSKSNVIGFIGGMDVPMIRRFECGYLQGARHINPDIKLITNFVSEDDGTFPWNNKRYASIVAKKQIAKDADVLFTASGNASKGSHNAAKEAGVYAIGVDSNQNHLAPGTMLTSMIKNLDIVVENAFNETAKGEFKAGTKSLGLAENGVGWALDKNNRKIVTPEMEKHVNELRDKIINGDISVHNYSVDNECPMK